MIPLNGNTGWSAGGPPSGGSLSGSVIGQLFTVSRSRPMILDPAGIFTCSALSRMAPMRSCSGLRSKFSAIFIIDRHVMPNSMCQFSWIKNRICGSIHRRTKAWGSTWRYSSGATKSATLPITPLSPRHRPLSKLGIAHEASAKILLIGDDLGCPVFLVARGEHLRARWHFDVLGGLRLECVRAWTTSGAARCPPLFQKHFCASFGHDHPLSRSQPS